MNRLREVYDRLPDAAKDAIFKELYEALLRRSTFHAETCAFHVAGIGELFGENGCDIELYT